MPRGGGCVFSEQRTQSFEASLEIVSRILIANASHLHSSWFAEPHRFDNADDLILVKGAPTSVAVAATTSKLLGTAAHALQSGSCHTCTYHGRTVDWGFACVQMPFQACIHPERGALCSASPNSGSAMSAFPLPTRSGNFGRAGPIAREAMENPWC